MTSPTNPAPAHRSPRLSEAALSRYVDDVFARVCDGTAAFSDLLLAVHLAEAMRDRAPVGGAS